MKMHIQKLHTTIVSQIKYSLAKYIVQKSETHESASGSKKSESPVSASGSKKSGSPASVSGSKKSELSASASSDGTQTEEEDGDTPTKTCGSTVAASVGGDRSVGGTTDMIA